MALVANSRSATTSTEHQGHKDSPDPRFTCMQGMRSLKWVEALEMLEIQYLREVTHWALGILRILGGLVNSFLINLILQLGSLEV
jgi:hypothetical protein